MIVRVEAVAGADDVSTGTGRMHVGEIGAAPSSRTPAATMLVVD
jgi:hypothetical protein